MVRKRDSNNVFPDPLGPNSTPLGVDPSPGLRERQRETLGRRGVKMIRPLEGRTFPRFRVRPPRGRGSWWGNPSHGLRRGLGAASPRWTPQAGSFEVYKQKGLYVIYRTILFCPRRPVANAPGFFYQNRTVLATGYDAVRYSTPPPGPSGHPPQRGGLLAIGCGYYRSISPTGINLPPPFRSGLS